MTPTEGLPDRSRSELDAPACPAGATSSVADRWQDRAACKGDTTVDWFPTMDRPGGQNVAWRANVARARQICATCPVRGECEDYALQDPLTAGIWAGTTDAERRGQQRPRRPHVARCGTDSGYSRHRNAGQEPCDECRLAHAIAERVRKIGRAS